MFLSQDKHTGIFYLYYYKRKGKRNKITTKTRDKAEVEKFMADFVIPKKKVIVKKDTAKEVTVWDYGFSYMTFCERHHRESTIRGYMFVMKSFRKWYGPEDYDQNYSVIVEVIDRTRKSEVYDSFYREFKTTYIRIAEQKAA